MRNYLEKEDTLLIEDSENGYKCGKSAGVDTLIVFREDDFDCDLEIITKGNKFTFFPEIKSFSMSPL